MDYVLSSRSDKQDDELACAYRLKNNFAYITNRVKRLGFSCDRQKKMIWKPAGFFPGLSWGWIVLDFFVQFCFFCCLAPTRDCVVTHINVVRCCVAVGWLSVCMCVNLQVIMSSPLLWLVAQTPKECLCVHVVYGMVGNVRVPIIWLVIG